MLKEVKYNVDDNELNNKQRNFCSLSVLYISELHKCNVLCIHTHKIIPCGVAAAAFDSFSLLFFSPLY